MLVTQSDENRDFLNVSVLLLIALCIGIYLIATTAIIAKDGVTFIEYAKQLEIAPAKTIIAQDQHPGYPWLILTSHKVMDSLHENTSVLSWIYCAQSITLIFRLLAITVLYFIAQHLFGTRLSFWCVLILILLPKPAEYGSDALSDWPHLFFMVTGVLLLLKGATNERWWLFGLAGVATGAGYLIRPECAILIVTGGLWLVLQLLWPKHISSRGKALFGFAIMLVGFLSIAGPYMNLKGSVFPKKDLGQLACNSKQIEAYTENYQIAPKAVFASQFIPSKFTQAFAKLGSNIAETLMWFFLPALLVGMHKWFKIRKWHDPEKFLIIVLIVLYIPVMIWLHYKHGYMSHRHTLPLLIIPILFVPVGLRVIAINLNKRFSKKAVSSAGINYNERFWFLVLLVIGICICTPKLLRPIRIEKQGYRTAARWLKGNTDDEDSIAVSDKRISYYAERKEVIYDNKNIPTNSKYVVVISKRINDGSSSTKSSGKQVYEYVSKSKRGASVTIYQNLPEK